MKVSKSKVSLLCTGIQICKVSEEIYVYAGVATKMINIQHNK